MNLLYEKSYKINDYISIRIPTLEEIIKNEEEYFGIVSMIVATPYDLMVQLDDAHIDFAKINDWELFCLLFKDLQTRDLSLVFDNLDLREFEAAVNKQNGNMVLLNRKTGAIIDRAIHDQICRFLRNILGIEKNVKKPANEEGRKFMIERARIKLKRKMRQTHKSELEKYIVALVNTSEFPYDYESVLKITIYQFYASLHQIIKKIKFDNLMIGCYAGTVNTKEINQDELNWISN